MPITNFRAGSVVTDTPANIVCLAAVVTTAGHFSGFKKDGVAYVVPANKTLIISRIIANSGSSPTTYKFHKDTAVIADDAAALTAGTAKTAYLTDTTANTDYEHDVHIPYAAGEYPAVESQASSLKVTAFGYVA